MVYNTYGYSMIVYRIYGFWRIWYMIYLVWEFPKIRGPNIDPQPVGSLVARLPRKRATHF